MMNLKKIYKFLTLTAMFLATSVFYQNCGVFDSGSGSSSGLSSGADTDIVAIPNTKTASVQRSSRVLDQLVSCLGTIEPSDNAKRAWINNKGTISEEGLANTMTQPMGKTIATVASEVCNDLVQKEASLEDSQRNIFVGIDLGGGGLANGEIVMASKRLARSCWGRNATDEELDAISDNISSAFSGEDDNQNLTRKKLIYLCTAMSSSFAAYEM